MKDFGNGSTTAFEALEGETFATVEGAEVGSATVLFKTMTGRKFRMDHEQDCCERVTLAEVHGDISDLLGTPILRAEESTRAEPDGDVCESRTWTFYRLQTIKGSVQLRWLGESNGYYSESVDFTEEVSDELA